MLQPGVGEEVIARSGEIDVHVVTHDYARRAGRGPDPPADGEPGPAGSAAICWPFSAPRCWRLGLWLTPDLHGLPTESLLMLTMVVATALVGGLWPAVLAAVLSSLALNFLFVPPTRTLTIADPENAFAILVFVVVGAAVAAVVDRSARRTAEAVRARAEANTLAVLAHSLLHSGDDPVELLRQAGEVLGMSGAALIDGADRPVTVAAWGDPPSTATDARVEVGPGLAWCSRGRALEAADQRLLTAYAAHFAVLEERRRARTEAVRTQELAEGNRTKTALLAAVSHDLRTPAGRDQGGHLQPAQHRHRLVRRGPGGAAGHRRGVRGPVGRAGRQPAGHEPAADGQHHHPDRRDRPGLGRRVDVCGGSRGAEPIAVTAPDDLPAVTADPGLLERVIANVVENALKHTDAEAIAVVGVDLDECEGGGGSACGWSTEARGAGRVAGGDLRAVPAAR